MIARSGGRAVATDTDVRLGALEHGAAFFLRAAHDASSQAFMRRAEHLDVGPGEFATLTIISENPGITQAQLSVTTSRHMSTLTPILRKLTGRGWIARTPVPSDRRSFALSLTASGKKRLLEIGSLAAEHERELDRIIGKARKAEFLRILRRIRALMP
jgi:DNA-binding MarR family transcriptional regulator